MSLIETRAIGQHVATKSMEDDVLCAFCAKPANKTCGRCGELYCSAECQLDDWRNHRFICIPLPQLLPLNNARSGHFSRRTSSRASLTSIGRIRQVAEKMVAAVPKDTSDPTTLDDEHDGIINEKIAIVEQNCDEKMVAVDDKNAAKKLIAALEAVSVQPTSTTLDISSSVIEPEKKSRISRSKMLETVETVAVVPKAVLLPPDSVVIVAYVRDHKTVVVRRMAMRGESDQHKQLIEMAIAGGINAERITSRPGVGDIVLALSNVHSMYGRACVEQINGRAALVYFLEFGCNETVDASNIKVIPDALGSSPCLLNEVTLTGVPASAKDPEKIVQYLTKLNHDQTLLQLKYADGKVSRVLPWKIRIEGELIDVRTSASINQKAIELNAPAPLISVVSESVALSESMENLSSCENVIELPHKGFSGEKVAVLVLDNSLLKLGYVSGIRVTDSAIFGENDERVNAYGMQVAKDPPFLPNELGMACVVRSAEDQRWYRALFMEMSSKDMCDVAYLDYGNLETVNISEIRQLDEKLRFPCITMSLYIDGVTWSKRKLSERLIDRMKELLPSYDKVTFDSIEYLEEEKMAIGKIQKIVKKLQAEEII